MTRLPAARCHPVPLVGMAGEQGEQAERYLVRYTPVAPRTGRHDSK